MKQFVYIIICISLISIGSLFFLKSPKGKPWLSVSDFYNYQSLTQHFDRVKHALFNKTKQILNNDEDPNIYKWQDDKGVWHYSDKSVNNANIWTKPENLTVIPAVKPLNNSEVKHVKHNGSNYSTDGVKKTNKVSELINDTHNVQHLMDNRTKTIDKQLESIND